MRYTAVVKSGETEDEQTPLLMRVELVTNSGKPVELLYGRPPEETLWLLDFIRSRLGVHFEKQARLARKSR